MAKTRVFSTHPLFDEARVILDGQCDVEYWAKPERPSRDEIASRIKDKDGLVCLLTDRINEDLLRAAPKLRIIANVAVGYDNLDVPACTKRNVIATNTPGVLDETTAILPGLCSWPLLAALSKETPTPATAVGRVGILIRCAARMFGARLSESSASAASVELSPAARRASRCASSIPPQSALPSKLKKNWALSIAT